jgi:hypothetical protein
MAQKVGKFIYWAPRILSILFLLFLAVFSLDVFDENLGFWGTVLGLFMHNIPVLVLLAAVIVAWKHEIVGGIVFILAGLAYMWMTVIRSQMPLPMALSWSLVIAGPAFLTGILFLINWRKKNKPATTK